MATEKSFYYLDGQGNKIRYYGKVMPNKDGTFKGILTKRTCAEQKVELVHHPYVEGRPGNNLYYTYMNADNEEVPYYSFVKTDEDGNAFFTYNTVEETLITMHPASTVKEVKYTYISNGEEKEWTKKVTYINGMYIGMC